MRGTPGNPAGRVLAEDVTPAYLSALETRVKALKNVTVVRGGGQVYRILVAVPVGSGALDALAQNSRTGFRMLSAAEKASLKPLRIRIVRAGNGDTVESLSQTMLGTTDRPGFFRVLNGLEPGEAIVAGQYYKTVTH